MLLAGRDRALKPLNEAAIHSLKLLARPSALLAIVGLGRALLSELALSIQIFVVQSAVGHGWRLRRGIADRPRYADRAELGKARRSAGDKWAPRSGRIRVGRIKMREMAVVVGFLVAAPGLEPGLPKAGMPILS